MENSPANVKFKDNNDGLVVLRGDPRGVSDSPSHDRAFQEGFTPAVLAYDTPWQNSSGSLATLTGSFGTPIAINTPSMDDIAVKQDRLANTSGVISTTTKATTAVNYSTDEDGEYTRIYAIHPKRYFSTSDHISADKLDPKSSEHEIAATSIRRGEVLFSVAPKEDDSGLKLTDLKINPNADERLLRKAVLDKQFYKRLDAESRSTLAEAGVKIDPNLNRNKEFREQFAPDLVSHLSRYKKRSDAKRELNDKKWTEVVKNAHEPGKGLGLFD